MIESAILNIGWIAFGAAVGAVIMFFVAQHNPAWIESFYRKQRAVSMQGTEEVDKLKKQVSDMELEKYIGTKTDALRIEIEKLKAQLKG